MNYLTKLFTTGAVRKTPQKVISVLLNETGNLPIETVVEIGAGRGELTSALLKNNVPTQYYAFEIDEEACKHLKEVFSQITVKQNNAFEFTAHLPPDKKLDLFVSSIPLSFYSRKQINRLLDQVAVSLIPGGKVIIVFTAFWLSFLLFKKFKGARLYSFFTFPPYFLFVYQMPVQNH